MASYRYDVLNRQEPQIRLIEVLSSDQDETIRCRLTTHDFSSVPEFTALSYTWGSGLADCFIELDQQKYQVGKNLWRFLQQMAALKTTGQRMACHDLLWIDAICINQVDQEERMHQVKQMARVYKTAGQVLAWLGPAYDDSDMAMKRMSRVRPKVGASQDALLKMLRQVPVLAMYGLCSRPYWTRLWIFQELMLAREITLMCGSETLVWNSFVIVVTGSKGLSSREQGRQIPRMYKSVWGTRAFSIAKQIVAGNPKRDLLGLMMTTSHMRCAEPHDKVFALLGVAQSGHHGIEPNYRRHLVCILNQVLRQHHADVPPSTLDEVVLQCKQLSKAVGLAPDAMFALQDEPPIGTSLTALPDSDIIRDSRLQGWSDGRQAVSLWWACLYRHRAVQRLLFNIKPNLGAVELVSYIEKGNRVAADLLLRAEDLDCKTDARPGVPILHLAVQRGYVPAIVWLLDDSRFPLRDPLGNTPVHIAVDFKQYEALDVLLRHAAKIQRPYHLYKNIGGETALHRAASKGREKFVGLLLKGRRGAASYLTDAKGQTPLHLAARNGHLVVVGMLLQILSRTTKLKFNARRDAYAAWVRGTGKTGLSNRTRDSTFPSPAAIVLLRPDQRDDHLSMDSGLRAQPNRSASRLSILMEDDSRSPLHLAAQHDHAHIVALLLKSKLFHPCSVDHEGYTALMLAVIGKCTKSLQKLLGADIGDLNAVDSEGLTALHLAVRHNNREAVSLLLNSGRVDMNSRMNNDLEGKNYRRFTALQLAADEGRKDIVQMLLMFEDIDTNLKTLGQTALDLARDRGFRDIVMLLEEETTDENWSESRSKSIRAGLRRGLFSSLRKSER